MSKITKVMDGFVKDETGQFHIVPWKMPDCTVQTFATKTKGAAEKKSVVKRKFIPIQPLDLTSFNYQESPKQSAKKSNIEKTIRMELFKMPQRKTNKRLSNNRQSNINRNSFKSRLSSFSKNNSSRNQLQNSGSPLLDVDEAEKRLSKNMPTSALFPIKSISEKNQSLHVENTPEKVPLTVLEKTPTSSESLRAEMEFLELEKRLASVKKNSKCVTESPMTSVCALLKNTKIASVNNDVKRDILDQVLILVKDDMEQFDLFKQQFAIYEHQHQNKMKTITELIEQAAENKENSNKRSGRLADQLGIPKIQVSPALATKIDLRKSTLNKNLHTESPRTKKAMDMYNNVRNDCTLLCTPKLDRTSMDLPHASVTRSLSRRIQKQCVLLQDTPRPN